MTDDVTAHLWVTHLHTDDIGHYPAADVTTFSNQF